jgi:hypothetical protein
MADDFKIDEIDTASGRLNKTADFNSPVSRRIASFAKREGGARGLTNSSITVGNSLGNMLDQSADIAKTDSTNIIGAKTSVRNAVLASDTQKAISASEAKAAQERLAASLAAQETIAARTSAGLNARSAAEQAGANSRNAASILSAGQIAAGVQTGANSRNDASNLSAAQIAAGVQSGANTRNTATISSNETLSAAQILAAGDRLKDQIASDETLSDEQIIAAQDRLDAQILSDGSISQAQIDAAATDRAAIITSQETIAANGNATQLTVATLSSDTQIKVQNLQLRVNDASRLTLDRSAAWAGYQATVSNIDPTASAASKNTVVTMATDGLDARLDFIDGVELGQLLTQPVEVSTAQRLYDLSASQGLSAAELARRTGYTEAAVNSWTEAQGLPSLSATTTAPSPPPASTSLVSVTGDTFSERRGGVNSYQSPNR